MSLTTRSAAPGPPRNGIYTVTETAKGDVHAIAINYPAFEQEGIIEVIDGTPDAMCARSRADRARHRRGAPTPATGFGSDAGARRLEHPEVRRAKIALRGHQWLSEGDDIAPILVALFDYDSVGVEFMEEGTVTLMTHVAGQAPDDHRGHLRGDRGRQAGRKSTGSR